MRLTSQSGSFAALDIVGYEQPAPETGTSEDDGGDWLIIRGHFADAGRSWEFENSCLDTDDASQLHAWLVGVADGAFAPSAAPGWGAHAISFAEHLLELRLIAHQHGNPVIRFLLSDLRHLRRTHDQADNRQQIPRRPGR